MELIEPEARSRFVPTLGCSAARYTVAILGGFGPKPFTAACDPKAPDGFLVRTLVAKIFGIAGIGFVFLHRAARPTSGDGRCFGFDGSQEGEKASAGQFASQCKRRKTMSFNFKDEAPIIPTVKIDGKDGTVSRSVYDGEERRRETVDEFNALIDFEGTQTGHVKFGFDSVDVRTGTASQPLPDSPGLEYKEIVQVPAYFSKYGHHILSVTAKGVRGSLGKVYDQWTAAPQRAEGLLPQVKMTRVVMNKTAKGAQAVPEFAIVGWKERPEALKNLGKLRAAFADAGCKRWRRRRFRLILFNDGRQQCRPSCLSAGERDGCRTQTRTPARPCRHASATSSICSVATLTARRMGLSRSHGPDRAGEIVHARLFGTDELDDAAEFAAAVNADNGCSVYVGMALRKPTTSRNKRAGEKDFLAATVVWADFDDDDAVRAAAQKCRATLMPTFAIYSGRHPHQRIQLFWRLSETIVGHWRTARHPRRDGARSLNGDPKVADPARVMRLAGSIAWPHKAGRIAEMTGILNLRDPGPPQYLPDEFRKAFPPSASVVDLEEERARRQDDASEATSQRWGKAWDGRESKMTRWVWGVVVDWYRESPIPPSARDSEAKCAESWAAFEQTITTKDPDKTLDEEGRGEALFRYKWNRAMRQWDTKVAEAAAQERPELASEDDEFAEDRISPEGDTEPLDFLGAFSAPPLPENVLPLAIEHHARKHARLMGCDPAAIAMSCLVAAAAAIPDTVRLRMKRHDPSWHESARLWVALVGPPSRKKTPAMNRALEQVNKINSRLVARYQERDARIRGAVQRRSSATAPQAEEDPAAHQRRFHRSGTGYPEGHAHRPAPGPGRAVGLVRAGWTPTRIPVRAAARTERSGWRPTTAASCRSTGSAAIPAAAFRTPQSRSLAEFSQNSSASSPARHKKMA